MKTAPCFPVFWVGLGSGSHRRKGDLEPPADAADGVMKGTMVGWEPRACRFTFHEPLAACELPVGQPDGSDCRRIEDSCDIEKHSKVTQKSALHLAFSFKWTRYKPGANFYYQTVIGWAVGLVCEHPVCQLGPVLVTQCCCCFSHYLMPRPLLADLQSKIQNSDARSSYLEDHINKEKRRFLD